MTPQEANEIIAEFMGAVEIIEGECTHCQEQTSLLLRYDLSLDALVPVWRAIHEESYFNITIVSDSMDSWLFYWDYFSTNKVTHESPLNQPLQEAAAIATAKAILAIMENQDNN